MRNASCLVFGALALGLSIGAGPAPLVDRTLLMRDVATLAGSAAQGRATGSPGGRWARQWILTQFRQIGLEPGDTAGYEQPFTVTTRDVRAVLPGGRPFRTDRAAANVIGRVNGRDARMAIVVTAHYDHLGIRSGTAYPGADDNASGVAVLLAAARHFVTERPLHPIVFAALDAEELGLRGARTLVASPVLRRDGVALNVNLDMVARSDSNEIYAAGTHHSPWQIPILEDVQRRTTVRILFGHDRPAASAGSLEDWTRASDHGPFHDAGIPFVYFGVEDHGDYHQATDTVERIDLEFFGNIADMIVDALQTFDVRLP